MMGHGSTARATGDRAADFARWSRAWFWSALLCVIVAGLARSYIATRYDGPQIDEAWHTVAGVSYVRTGDFRLNPEHPPLVKFWVGMSLPQSAFKLAPFRPLEDKADERTFIDDAFYLDNDPRAVQGRVRVAMLAFHGVLLLVLALCLERVFGSLVAVLLLALLVVDPTVAAHLPLVLTDLPLCLLSAISALTAYLAFRSFRAVDLLLTAAALGLTLASKHSAIVSVAGVGVVGLGLCFVKLGEPGTPALPRRLLSLAGVALGAYLTLCAFYGFRFSEHPRGVAAFGAGVAAAPARPSTTTVPSPSTPTSTSAPSNSTTTTASPSASTSTPAVNEYDVPLLFNRPLASKIADLQSPLHRAVLRYAHELHLLPRAYLWGLADILRVGVEGREEVNFVFGKRLIRITPWYFFPAVLCAKLPLGTLLLACFGLVLAVRRRVPRSHVAAALALSACAGVFLLFIMRGNSGYAGVRHVLPVFVAITAWAALALAYALRRRSLALGIASGVAASATLVSALPVMRPWEYFNELAGGAENAWQNFNDDGLDNGQRTRELAAYYDAHLRGTSEPVYDFYGLYDHQKRAYDLDIRSLYNEPLDSEFISGSVFVTTRWLLPRPNYGWEAFLEAKPVARIGNLLVLRGTFHLPWLPALRRRARIEQALVPGAYDPQLVEQMLHEITAIYPQDYRSSFELGNLLVERGATEPAKQAYTLCRTHVPVEDGLTPALTGQIESLARGDARVKPLRSPWLE